MSGAGVAFAGKSEPVRIAAEKAGRWAAKELAKHSWQRKGKTTAANAPARIAKMNAWEEGARVVRCRVGKPSRAYARGLGTAVLARFEMLLLLPTGGPSRDEEYDGASGDAQPALWHCVVEKRGDYSETTPYVLVKKAPAVALSTDLRTVEVESLKPPWISLLEEVHRQSEASNPH